MKINKSIICLILFTFLLSFVPKIYSASAAEENNLLVTIDSNKYYVNDRLQISGWILSKDNIKNVDVYIGGIFKGSFGPSINREDVYNAYPKYNNHNAGFNFVCNISDISDGDKTIKFVATTKNGQTIESTQNINIKRPKGFTVVVDPGHCSGKDDGTYKTVNGVNYSEAQLNLQISFKLREKLQNSGYSVVMTRENNDALGATEAESLQKRCEIANNTKANLFVSIHQNAFDYKTSGTEGYYYETNAKAKELLAEITKNVSAILGNNNRGPKPDTLAGEGSLYVIRHTNMTSILVECGFMDNASDVSKLSSDDYQYKIADAITNAIIKVYGTADCYEKGEPSETTKAILNNADVSTKTPSSTSTPGSTTPSASTTPGNNDNQNKPGDPTKPSTGDGQTDVNDPGNQGASSTPQGGENNGSKTPGGSNDKPSDNKPQNTLDTNNLLILTFIILCSTVFCCKMKKA